MKAGSRQHKRVLHSFKHIDSLLSIALSDLFECLVFVTPMSNIALMDDVVLRLLRIAGFQLLTESLEIGRLHQF